MNNHEHIAAFVEECEKRELVVHEPPLSLDIGTNVEPPAVVGGYFYNKGTPGGWLDKIDDALRATRERFGLPPTAGGYSGASSILGPWDWDISMAGEADYVNVTDHGADPTGERDSSAAIQGMINAASDNPIGRLFKPGTYPIKAATHWRCGTCLRLWPIAEKPDCGHLHHLGVARGE